MICPICGANNGDNVTFCSQCGTDMTNTPVAYTQQQQGYSNANEGKGLAITSLVLGILGVTICPSLIPSILAVVFGAISKKKATSAKGMATAGFVLGLIPLILAVVGIILYIVYIIFAFGVAGIASIAIISSEM